MGHTKDHRTTASRGAQRLAALPFGCSRRADPVPADLRDHGRPSDAQLSKATIPATLQLTAAQPAGGTSGCPPFGCSRRNVFRRCGTAPTHSCELIISGSDCGLLEDNRGITPNFGGLPERTVPTRKPVRWLSGAGTEAADRACNLLPRLSRRDGLEQMLADSHAVNLYPRENTQITDDMKQRGPAA
jgi:hypothetical protein